MREVLLHIGMHKTGTSTLQAALYNYKDSKTKYASFNNSNHSVPMYSIFGKDIEKSWLIKRNFTLSKFQAQGIKNRKILNNETKDNSFERLIISAEKISKFSEQEKLSLLSYFDNLSLSTHIFMCTRSPSTFAMSSMQQIIKTGGVISESTFSNPRYKERLDTFYSNISKDKLFIFDFDDGVNKGFFEHYSNLFNVRIQPSPKVNISMSLQEFTIINTFNRNVPEHMDPYILRLIRSEFINQTVGIFSTVRAKERIPKCWGWSFLSPDVLVECEWLDEKFKIKYELKTPKIGKSEILKKMEQSLSLYQDEVTLLFKKLGLNYDTNLSLDSNILNLINYKYEQQIA